MEDIDLYAEWAESKGKDPCWKGYEQKGYKKKGNKSVPNCVKKLENYSEWEFSGARAKKIFQYGKYKIGAEFLPGDIRHGRVLQGMGYGHIRKRKGKDGMALDCYFKERCLSNNKKDCKVFIIKQIKEDGSFDEEKYMLGWKTKEGAQRAYLSVMPARLFGGIR